MIPFFFTGSIATMLVIWALQALSYYGIIRKMGFEQGFAFVPIAAEWKMSHKLFASMRAFYQPALSSLIFLAASRYVGSRSYYSILFWLAGIFVYSLFLMRLHWRISKSFNMGVPFRILTVLFPVPCLLYLGFGKAQFTQPEFSINQAPPVVRWLLNAAVFLITAAEFVVLIAVVGFFSIRENPPRPLVEYLINDTNEAMGNVTEQGEVVRREDVLDAAVVSAAAAQRSRDYYYPDHSADQSVVVMEYVVATDLESDRGYASVNIEQIRNATKQGSDMTFVLQVGAAERLFTSGMEDGSYARYTINDGKIEKALDLDPSTCMTEKESLTDFIKWTKENYPADRYMLVFWDHGGGLTYGYGSEQLNKRADGERLMPTSEIVEAVKDSGVKFDLIGFDTCLMQDFDLAYRLEPYTDYFLASEESESGFGWNYTLGFSELAKDPGLSTEQFGTYMISSFDPYNTISKNGTPDTSSTLSLLDMTYVKPAHEKLDKLFAGEQKAIRDGSDNYANISIAASGAYTFIGDTQLDLIDYLTRLEGLDYENAILTAEQYKDLIDSVKACVDCQVAAYMRTKDGRMYLGSDHVGALDENGNPMVALENSWPHIGGALICYNAAQARDTEEGTVFSGTTTALLNGKTQIKIFIECDPVKEASDQPMEAHITGYELVNDPLAFMRKGLQQLEAGDTLQFLFDFYDDQGNLVKTDTYGKKVRILRTGEVTVKDEPFGECDLQFGGMLTDIYQRTFLTETLETHVEK